jgi:pseudaminic acid synthase
LKTIIIAEISANHGQDIEIALATIKAAKEAGADAVKLQTYNPDTMTLDCNNEYFQIKQGTIWDGQTLYELYKEAYTPWDWHEKLFAYAREIDIEIFSTPFDFTAVDLLESLNVNKYKIASFEITDTPLIEYSASKGKPMIISTGIATLNEIDDAVQACRRMGNNDITLLQCTSQYPAEPTDANLLTMIDMKKRFDVKVGLSDHTLGSEVALLAVAMGADIIEKHFILDRAIGGPDAAFSMLPHEFKEMVEQIRRVEEILGEVSYELTEKKKASRTFVRSLFVVCDVKAGETITGDNVKSIRPGYGISPKYLGQILGKRFVKDIERGTPVSWDIIE